MEDDITIEVTVPARTLSMSSLDMREQLAEDDALAAILGRQVLARARTILMERIKEGAV